MEIKKATVIISTGSRSEEYVKPLIKRLEAHPDFELIKFEHKGEELNFISIYTDIMKLFENIDFIIIPSDRFEHLPVAIAAFQNNIPIVQLYGGDVSGQGTFDDLNRYVYSIYASVIFCSTDDAAKRVQLLNTILDKDNQHVYVVGMTHFDDVEIDESEVLDKPYDIVLYNPLTRGKDRFNKMIEDLNMIVNLIDKRTIWIEPNEDAHREVIINFAKSVTKVEYQNRMNRTKFFGFLKNCARLITNSSMAAYEGSKFLSDDQIVHIGDRNMIRERVPYSVGGSDDIIKILEKEFLVTEK